MATESTSKRYAGEVDRISNLPECLLYDILSLLPTKQAVATSALSKSWKLLWTKLTVLDFQHSVTRNQYIGNNNGRMTFTHFVCNVLLLRKPLPVKKFRLALDSFDDSIHFHVSSWICYAVDHGVEELELLLLFRKPFELPCRFFGCKSLKIVTLYGDIVLNCPSFLHLPYLKDLHLGSQLCSNEDSFRSLLTGIPNLITFFIGRVRRDDVTAINICHPRLLFFCIQNKVPFPFKIEIDAPSLKCLSFFDGSGQDSLTTNIVKATFDLSEHKQQADKHDSCGHLLTELPSVQSLLVRHTKVRSLRFGFSLPMLNILRSLQFDAKCCKWHILPRLLESAPNLEKLILHKVDTDGPHELCCWTDPPHVPKCLESCLRIISLVKFKCWEHDLEFVQLFLKNAKVLEKMGILTGLLDLAENSRILKNFSELPRGSSKCELFLLNVIKQADEHDSCGHLITELPSVQSLLVRHTKVRSLRFGFSLPMLNILRSLQFDAKCCKWHILPRLLESAPNLEKLILHKVDTDGPHELCCWTDPPHVPKCLESCLWIISLVKFKCWEHDLEFVQFFLKNAKVLEKMGILTGLLDLAENSRILKKFSELPRGSSNCELFLLNG